MKIALWSSALAYDQVSITHRRTPPESIRYVAPGDPTADVLMATHENDHWPTRMLEETKGDTRPKVLWRQEARWIMPNAWPAGFDLILSCDERDFPKTHIEAVSRFMPFLGTWLTGEEPQEKEYDISMVASDKYQDHVEGYRVRHEIRKALGKWEHGYGHLFSRRIETKDEGLGPYRFSIAVESQRYPWYHTEKLFDCFAARTVPIYWGCEDTSKLEEWGFDPAGIIRIPDAAGAVECVRKGPGPQTYEAMHDVIEHNFKRTMELYCTEVALEKVLREALCLA